MTKERRLGRGLEALLGRVPPKEEATAEPSATESEGTSSQSPVESPVEVAVETAVETPVETTEQPSGPRSDSSVPSGPDGADDSHSSSNDSFVQVDVDRIDSNPFQPRTDFDQADIQSLCDSLREHGLLQPLVARAVGDRYQLIAGERRLRAAVKAGWPRVPVQVLDATDRQMAELAIVENLQRKDLNPLEKAASFQKYIEQFGCTQEELARRLKLDRSTIANAIRLLELPQAVQNALRQGRITQGHARALLPLGDEHEQIEFCQRIQREGLSVRKTEAAVQEAIEAADAEPLSLVGRDGKSTQPRRITSAHVAALEQEFRSALGCKVKITHTARGRGKLVVHFSNHDEFERLREHICGPAVPKPAERVG